MFGQVHKRIAGSIAGVLLASGVAPAQELIEAGAVWNYDDTGTDLGSAWRAAGFDDNTWALGAAPLGYGDGDETTTLSFGPDSNDKYATYYFRRDFEVLDPNAFPDLTLRVRRDDGCVLYLNGLEVVRSNMPPGTITYATFASASIGGAGESAWHDFSIDPSLLLAGTNVLAVEVHQRGPGSSDLTFDLRLLDANAPNPPVLVAPADGATVVSSSAVLKVNVSDPDGQALDVTFYGHQDSPGDEFTIVALPDTQFYSETASAAAIYRAQTQWIVDNAVDRNIVFVTHEGDLVQRANVTSEWKRANAAMSLLDGIVPYGMAPGNHDQPTILFNVYFPFTRYQSEPWYGGHFADKNDNNFQTFSAGGIDFIIIHTEFCPSVAAIQWADSVLKAHPDHTAIITTHGFINPSGVRSAVECGSTQYIWDGLVVPNPNVHFVLCGHQVPGEFHRRDVVNGHPVHQLLANYQDRANGGNGFLRTMRFVPKENKVYVRTYSPWLDRFESDANSEFTLDFQMTELSVTGTNSGSNATMTGFSLLGANTGVGSGSNATMTWTGLDNNAEYQWFVSVTDSTNQTVSSPVFSFTTGSDLSDPPVISGVDAINITDRSTTIVWSTDEPADSTVDYGRDNAYGSQTSNANHVRSHSIHLTGLSAKTTYHFRVTSADGPGNSASTANFRFTTSMANRLPVADDQSVVTLEDTEVRITLTATDPDLDRLAYAVVVPPAHGSLSGTAPDLTYTPDRDYDADDRFAFKANDGLDDSNIATVTISVEPVADASERIVTSVDTGTLENLASDEPSPALQFDGRNDHVTLGQASALGLRTFTLETWFRQDGSGASSYTGVGGLSAVPLISKGRGEGDGTNRDMNYFLGIDGAGRLVADFEEGAGGSSPGRNHPVVGITHITQGQWHHAAATYDGTIWRLYLDGNLQASLVVGEPPRHDSIQHAALATSMNSSGSPRGYFNGALDEARIWNHARSLPEILARMNQELVAEVGLVSRWGMNEGTGTVAHDSVGRAHGNLTNGPRWVSRQP